jgi:hypothetical protein
VQVMVLEVAGGVAVGHAAGSVSFFEGYCQLGGDGPSGVADVDDLSVFDVEEPDDGIAEGMLCGLDGYGSDADGFAYFSRFGMAAQQRSEIDSDMHDMGRRSTSPSFRLAELGWWGAIGWFVIDAVGEFFVIDRIGVVRVIGVNVELGVLCPTDAVVRRVAV